MDRRTAYGHKEISVGTLQVSRFLFLIHLLFCSSALLPIVVSFKTHWVLSNFLSISRDVYVHTLQFRHLKLLQQHSKEFVKPQFASWKICRTGRLANPNQHQHSEAVYLFTVQFRHLSLFDNTPKSFVKLPQLLSLKINRSNRLAYPQTST